MALLRPLVLLVALLGPSVAAQELITNGTIQSGSSGWQLSGAFFADSRFNNYHNGPGYAYLSNSDGSGGNNLNGTLKQTFTIPNNITSATLRFWYSITTSDSPSTPFDVVSVSLQPSNTFVTVFSNTNAGGYREATFNLTSFAGQTVTLQFLGTTNATNPTTFRIDDVSATYVSAPTTPAPPSNLQAVGNGAQILLGWQDHASTETGFELERKPLGGFFVAWKSVNANVTAAEDTQGYGSTTCYRVRATNSSGPSGYTNEACATSLEPPTLLQPPDGTTTSSTSVTMTWQSTTGATFYALNVGTTCGGTQYLATETTQSTYTLTGAPGTYVWRVRAANSTYPGLSQPSACHTFTISNTTTPPNASFTWSPSAPTTSTPVQFSDTSTNNPTSWSWAFGDGATASVQHPVHTYASSGTYTVTLAVSNAGGSDTETKQVTVGTAVITPVANFSYNPTSPAPGQPVSFTDTSTNNPTSWAWDFDNNGTIDSTLQHPTAAFAAAGTYTVKFTATNTAGSNSKTKSITVSTAPQAPVANFTYSPATPTTSTPVHFTDTSTNNPTSWAWDFDNNGTTESTVQHPDHTYPANGNYTAKLTVTNNASSNSTTKTITVSNVAPAPVADFTVTPNNPAVGQSVSFTDTSTGNPTNWSWAFDDGGTATTKNPSHAFATARTYNVKLTVTNSAGSNTRTKNITVDTAVAKPVARFTPSARTATVGEEITFTDKSTGAPTNWSWRFGDGQRASSQNTSHTYTATGSYEVTLMVSNVVGSDSMSQEIVVTASPISITGHVVTRGQIAVKGDRPDRVVSAFNSAGTKTTTAQIDRNGRFSLQVPPGTYQLQATIAYRQYYFDTDGDPVQEVRVALAMSGPRSFTTNTTQDIMLPDPVVLLHGFFSSSGTWDRWISTARGYRPDLIVLTPDYNWLDPVDVAAHDVYKDIEAYLSDIFVATPTYRIVAHSKGGLVARSFLHNYHGLPVPDNATDLVMLGTPNSGAQCWSSGSFELDACTVREANKRVSTFGAVLRARVHVIAGTAPWLTSVVCADRPTPNDGLVAVDSVFAITFGDGADAPRDVLDGFVVAMNHLELPKSSWLTIAVLDLLGRPFPACPKPRYEPAQVVNCDAPLAPGKYCLEGRGYSADGRCNVLTATSTAVNLSWTISGTRLHLDGTIGTAAACVASAATTLSTTDETNRGFEIHRSASPLEVPSLETRIGYVPSTARTFSDTVAAGTTMYYQVVPVTTEQAQPSNILAITAPPSRQRAAHH